MKFCLSSQLGEKFLSKADEIKTKNLKEVKPLLRKFKKANIIYEVQPNDLEPVFQELDKINKEYDNRLICCCRGVQQMLLVAEFHPELKIYNGFYATTYLEVHTNIDAGAVYLKIGAPLTHDLETIAHFGIPIRITPNIAYEDAIYKAYAIEGSWVRPEDYDVYNQFNIVYEFENCDAGKEAILFDIYKNKKTWAGPISYLISNIDTNALNRLIPPDLAQERIKCKQKCLANGRCHLCYNYFALADEEMLGKIVKS